MKNLLLSFLGLLLVVGLQAQEKYWISYNSCSSETPYLDPTDLAEKLEINILYKSKWLSAFSAYLDEVQIEKLNSYPFITEIKPVQILSVHNIKIDSLLNVPDRKLEALKHKAFIEAGLDGAGVKIGVLDAGFLGYETSSFSEATIVNTRNFIDPSKTNLDSGATYDFNEDRPKGIFRSLKWFRAQVYHSHGKVATELIAGKSSYGRSGMSSKAELYLGKTEEGLREYKAEEDHWIAGLEWLHEQGVRLVNTSLGYTKKREDKSNNYKPSDMNGTSMIARVAQIAVNEKGMILVISAGNEGKKRSWRIISTPADAKDVISVGATRPHSFQKEDYSSIGPEFLDYIKPDVSAISPAGTSFSAPLITGFIGCMLQKKPDLTPSEVKNLLERASQLFPYKNNYVGYGLPQADKVLALLDNSDIEVHESSEIKSSDKSIVIKKEKNRFITVFHKKDTYFVKDQERIKVENGQFIIKRKRGVKRSTVLHGRKVIEIYWE